MKNKQKTQMRITSTLWTSLAGMVLLIFVLADTSSFAYERYKEPVSEAGWCSSCHGDFTDSMSQKGSVFPGDDKHTMHRGNSYMNADCDLCHKSTDERNPWLGSSDGTDNNDGLGCNGCHNAKGLRAHHAANGVMNCAACHANDHLIVTVLESGIPPYYGTADTNVDDPLNSVAAANTGENWTIGDFIGTDNDGDNLYDMADFDGGHPFIIATSEVIGNDLQISWASAGGRCEVLQQVDNLSSNFVDIGSVVTNSGVGVVTNNVTIAGGATSLSNRFFRVRYTYPAL